MQALQIPEPPLEQEGTRPVIACDDLRFRRLLGREAWERLPLAVRHRFAKRLSAQVAVSYTGTITECRISRTGWLLVQLCRLIGAPLPLSRDTGTAAVVTVTEDGDGGGQVWTRIYARRHGFPQVIHSAKRFAGATGLEEYLAAGFGIALKVEANEAGISFLSDHYFLRMGKRRVRLPTLLCPGQLTIDHADLGGGCFAFALALQHPLMGELIRQVGHFRDQPAMKRGTI